LSAMGRPVKGSHGIAAASNSVPVVHSGFVANFAQEGMQGQQPLSVERLSG
jgi:hypothetical protein